MKIIQKNKSNFYPTKREKEKSIIYLDLGEMEKREGGKQKRRGRKVILFHTKLILQFSLLKKK